MPGKLFVVLKKYDGECVLLHEEKRFAGDNGTPVRVGEVVVFEAGIVQETMFRVDAIIHDAVPEHIYLLVTNASLPGVTIDAIRKAVDLPSVSPAADL